MYVCSKNIIDCLRDRGINPIATAKTEYSNAHNAIKGIDYTTTNQYESKRDAQSSEWWMIDFKKVIFLGNYSISTPANGCYWIRKWRALASLDNITWLVIDAPPFVNARYFKLETINGSCGYSFAFKYIYFYGLIPEMKNIFTCNRKRSLNISVFLLRALIYS